MMDSPRIAVVMGSNSDAEIMDESARVLRELKVPFEMGIYSAHRTPERSAQFAAEAASRGIKVIIAGAGAAAHLAGSVASRTHLPVIGVPLASTSLQGFDALLATVQMPSGFPVATMAIGKAGAVNAAILAIQILALEDEELAEKIAAWRARKASAVEAASEAIAEKSLKSTSG
jgi:phosphoribosylaminoimidazole carboxylase PurE protein